MDNLGRRSVNMDFPPATMEMHILLLRRWGGCWLQPLGDDALLSFRIVVTLSELGFDVQYRVADLCPSGISGVWIFFREYLPNDTT